MPVVDLTQVPANPRGFSPAVNDGVNRNDPSCEFVVDPKRKPFREQPVKGTMGFAMDARISTKRLDIREQTLQEILAESSLLAFVKELALEKIVFGLIENPDGYLVRSMIRSFARLHAVNLACPSSANCFRSSRTRLCQSYTGTSPGTARESHSRSMRPSFSSCVMCSRSIAADMRQKLSPPAASATVSAACRISARRRFSLLSPAFTNQDSLHGT